MKYLFLFFALFSTLMAEKVTIGAGAYMQTQPYKDVDAIITPSPVIFFDNSLFYVRWTRAGIYFLGDKQESFAWGFSLTAQPRINQYEASDSEYLRGMENKKSSIEAGLAFSASKEKAFIEIMALSDALARHDTWILKTEIGYEFALSNFTFYPSFIMTYQSSAFMDYYYGVKPSEATPFREEYKADYGMQYGVQTYIKYPLTQNLASLVNLKADKLPSEATNSPIVADDYIFSGLVSLIYTFDY